MSRLKAWLRRWIVARCEICGERCKRGNEICVDCATDCFETLQAFRGGHLKDNEEEVMVEDNEVQRLRQELQAIRLYAANEHPFLSSHPCPLCEWDSVIEDGWWKGTMKKRCSFHACLDEMYDIKVDQPGDNVTRAIALLKSRGYSVFHPCPPDDPSIPEIPPFL